MKFEIIVSLVATMILSAILTPFVRKLAFRVGAIDNPNARRVNKCRCPRWVVWQFFFPIPLQLSFLLRFQIPTRQLWGVFAGECVIIATGIIDDISRT